ncbi:MAG: acetolactate synthase small subunit, partial [Candidatus Hydrothermarchaeota archaeon]
AFIDLVKIYGILELARTGITAMIRGAKREVKK